MLPRYAILLDGGFVITKLKKKLGRFPTARDVIAECERIKREPILEGHDLLRIYFYHAPPPTKNIKNPLDGSEIDVLNWQAFKDSEILLKELEMSKDFALRMGELAYRGWQLGTAAIRNHRRDRRKGNPRSLEPGDLIPSWQQKGVDLRIGLDIARLSLKEFVRAIVVVTGDSDMIPAFKFARREGIRVYLDCMDHQETLDTLKIHTDCLILSGGEEQLEE